MECRTIKTNFRHRYLAFDIAKAICIILVVIGHYSPEFSPSWYMTIHDIIYSFHMPLFMFASGFIYIATKRDEPYLSFINRKIRRLMIPYFVVSVLIISIKLLLEHNVYMQHPVTIKNYIEIFYTPSAGYFLWFIWALWWMFLIIPFFKSKKLRLIVFVISLLCANIHLETTKIFCVPETLHMFVYFMLGIMCFDYRKLMNKVSSISPVLIIFLFIVCETLYQLHISQFIGTLLPFIGIAFVMNISEIIKALPKERTKWIFRVSGSSYIISLVSLNIC